VVLLGAKYRRLHPLERNPNKQNPTGGHCRQSVQNVLESTLLSEKQEVLLNLLSFFFWPQTDGTLSTFASVCCGFLTVSSGEHGEHEHPGAAERGQPPPRTTAKAHRQNGLLVQLRCLSALWQNLMASALNRLLLCLFVGMPIQAIEAAHRECGAIYCFQALGEITESQNHRIVGVGRDLCGSSTPCRSRVTQSSQGVTADYFRKQHQVGSSKLDGNVLSPAPIYSVRSCCDKHLFKLPQSQHRLVPELPNENTTNPPPKQKSEQQVRAAHTSTGATYSATVSRPNSPKAHRD